MKTVLDYLRPGSEAYSGVSGSEGSEGSVLGDHVSGAEPGARGKVPFCRVPGVQTPPGLYVATTASTTRISRPETRHKSGRHRHSDGHSCFSKTQHFLVGTTLCYGLLFWF